MSNGFIQEAEKDNLKYLILFSTSKQKTWILANKEYLFCFLDDTSKDSFELRWKERKINLLDSIKIKADFKEKTGIVDFGANHKRWLYSKELYKTKQELSRKIDDLLK